MWDLTVSGNNDHDFYVLSLPQDQAGGVGLTYAELGLAILAHNISYPCRSEIEDGLSKANAARDAFENPGKMTGHAVFDDGTSADLSSGHGNVYDRWEAPPGTTDENWHHLENQTASMMRQKESQGAILYLGDIVDEGGTQAAYGPCPNCRPNIGDMIPPGSGPTVIWRNASGAIRNAGFIGRPD